MMLGRILLLFSLSTLGWGCALLQQVDTSAKGGGADAHDRVATSALTGAAKVTTDLGSIQGVEVERATAYLGIPYAKPPVGELRFQAPQAIEPWAGTLDATRVKSRCTQSEERGSGEEDCLYLNIFVPYQHEAKVQANRKLPVMFFIHGGAFDNGSGVGVTDTDTLYSGEKLARLGNVIVVTTNYRLGILGFLSHPALRTAGMGSGNYGILDQIMAMEWVSKHIAKFGGDTSNVTLFGESAGAMSICTHVAQKYKRGLFQRAIMQSGYCASTTQEKQDKAGVTLAERLGCGQGSSADVLACLRGKTIDEFMAVQTNFGIEPFREKANAQLTFLPVVDGLLYDQAPLEVLKSGQGQLVDMIVGSNQNEVPPAVFFGVLTERDFDGYLRRTGFASEEVQKLKTLYPPNRIIGHRDRASAVATDTQFTCPAIDIGRAMSARGARVFHYRYDLLRGVHGTELPSVFQKRTLSTPNMREMGLLWTSFARDGAPQAEGFKWQPSRNGESTKHLIIAEDALHHVQGFRRLQCEVISNSKARTH